MNILDFKKKKNRDEKITVVTCYDYTSARIVDASDVDCVLVGDTLAMTMHGYPTTVPATVEIMALHTAAVARGITKKFIVGDLPFLSYRISQTHSMEAIKKLMHAGAHAVKLEGVDGNVQLIRHVVESGVPVMGHLGLTPQSVHQLGGFRVQGKNARAEKNLLQQAELLEEAGCFAIVLECIPSKLAEMITDALKIPTIGIGAGPHTSGQVLVFQDMLGLQQEIHPKFVKSYLNGFSLIKDALNHYHQDVQTFTYPDEVEHCY